MCDIDMVWRQVQTLHTNFYPERESLSEYNIVCAYDVHVCLSVSSVHEDIWEVFH